jgi:hypothetical protein
MEKITTTIVQPKNTKNKPIINTNEFYKKKKNKKTTNKKVKNTQSEIDRIHKQIQKMKIGNYLKSNSNKPTSYLQSLLLPEDCIASRISGSPEMTVTIRRKATYTLVVNAAGAANITWQPMLLQDTTNQASYSTLFSVAPTNTTYDGISVAGATGPIAIQLPQNITPSSVIGYRLVSAAMHIIPQMSVLNQAGTIHAALCKQSVAGTTALGTVPGTGIVGCEFFPNYQDMPFYEAASISNQEGARIIWLPGDECFTEFTNINTSYSASGAESCYTLCAVVVGAPATSTLRIDFYQNYEVTIPNASILSGMEGYPTEKGRPQNVWFDIITKHKHDIVKTGRSINSVAALNKTVLNKMPLDTGIRIGKGKYSEMIFPEY